MLAIQGLIQKSSPALILQEDQRHLTDIGTARFISLSFSTKLHGMPLPCDPQASGLMIRGSVGRIQFLI